MSGAMLQCKKTIDVIRSPQCQLSMHRYHNCASLSHSLQRIGYR